MHIRQALSSAAVFFLCGFLGCSKQKPTVEKPASIAALALAPSAAKVARKSIASMSIEELRIAKDFYLAEHTFEPAVTALERLIALSTSAKELEEATLQLAYLQFEEGNFEKARTLFADYSTRFPGGTHLAQVRHDEMRAHFLDAKTVAMRDQTRTRAAVALGESFLSDYGDSNSYADSVKEMLKVCYRRLIDSEVRVAQFYLNSHTYDPRDSAIAAARARIAAATTEYQRLCDLDPNFSPIVTTWSEQLALVPKQSPLEERVALAQLAQNMNSALVS